MKSFRVISRFVAVTSVVFVGSVCAVTFQDAKSGLKNNQFTIGSALFADRFFDKNDHFQKAFFETAGRSFDKGKTMTAEDFAQNLVLTYGFHKGKKLLHDRGIDAHKVLKKVDFLPDGIVRDIVNPVVEGAVEAALHPAFLTWLAHYIITSYSNQQN